MQPFVKIIGILRSINKFVKELPQMIKGLSDVTMALDHLYTIESTMNYTVTSYNNKMLASLSTLSQLNICIDDNCRQSLQLAINATKSLKGLPVYKNTPVFREGIKMAIDAQKAIESQISEFHIIDRIGTIRRDIAKMTRRYTSDPLRRLDNRVSILSTDIRKIIKDIKSNSHSVNRDMEDGESQVIDVLSKVNMALIFMPLGFAAITCVIFYILLTQPIMGEPGIESVSRSNICFRLLLILTYYLLFLVIWIAFGVAYSRLVIVDTAVCLHDRRLDSNSTMASVASSLGNRILRGNDDNGGFAQDDTWSRLVNAELDNRTGYAVEQMRGVDFWKFYDACSQSASLYSAAGYAMRNAELFNVTGLTSIYNYGVEVLKKKIIVNTTLGDIKVLSSHTWIKSRIAGDFMKSFDANYYRQLINKPQTTMPILDYIQIINNFISPIKSTLIPHDMIFALLTFQNSMENLHKVKLVTEVSLLKAVNETEGPISFPIEHQVDELMRSQRFLKRRGNRIVNEIVNDATSSVYRRLEDYSRQLRDYITDKLGRCKSVSDAYDAYVSATCTRVIHKYELYTSLLWVILNFSILAFVIGLFCRPNIETSDSTSSTC